MGKIYRDGIIYAGGGNIKECTLAQFNEWKSNGQLVKGVTYNIIDAPNLNETAKEISYDGTTTSVWEKVESKANKTWEYIGKITNGDTGLDVSNKSEVLIVGFANNNTRYLSFVFPMAEILGVATVIVIEGTGTNKYVGEIAVDSNYKISTTQYSIAGWSSMYLKIYAR